MDWRWQPIAPNWTRVRAPDRTKRRTHCSAPDSIVPGAGALTAAPHDAVAQQAWAQGGGTPTTPQELNRYAYAQNAPLRCTDPTGHWIESAVDSACIADDIWDITQNGLTWDTGLALAADVGGLLLPGLTGGGMLVRAVARGNEALDAARGINTAVNAVPAANLADNIHAAGQLRYLRHADPVAFETLMGLGARSRGLVVFE